METKELAHIKISRVIPASKWMVIRLLTKVWEFPNYVETIREASVVEKSRHTIKTQWRILMDGLPISWTEEDTLALHDNTIYFKAVKGDLEEFHGAWRFQDHREGTEVTVEAYFRVGIPAIKEFAESYIKGLVTKNFESILESIENRLINKRYASFKEGNVNKVAGFGLLGHFYNFNHLTRGLKMLNPDFKLPSREFLGKLFTVTPAFKMYETDNFKSKTGETTHGCIILCTFIPDMIENNVDLVYSKVVRACKLAEKNGVGVVTLGGFTSMAGEKLGHKIAQDVDIPITTGNTLTTALAIDGIEKAVELLELDWKKLKVTIIGGTGDIGSGCGRILAEKVGQVTITGRTKSNLRAVHAQLKKVGKAKIESTTDNRKAVKDADVVLATANVPASILTLENFKPGAIICDLAYPKNISYTSTMRDDILVFSGGLAAVPSPIETGIIMGLPSSNVCYGCSCEAIVLALEKRFENFSFGRWNITAEKVNEIRAMARKHGFGLAPFFWANKVVNGDDIEQIKRVVRRA